LQRLLLISAVYISANNLLESKHFPGRRFFRKPRKENEYQIGKEKFFFFPFSFLFLTPPLSVPVTETGSLQPQVCIFATLSPNRR
jgi:hypothetical protein